MTIKERLTAIETKLKYIEKLMYVIGALILTELGVSVI